MEVKVIGKDEGDGENRLHFDVEHRNMIFWEDEDDLAKRAEDRIGALM